MELEGKWKFLLEKKYPVRKQVHYSIHVRCNGLKKQLCHMLPLYIKEATDVGQHITLAVFKCFSLNF